MESGKVVLINDDDFEIVALLENEFTRHGWSTITSTRGLETLELIRQRRPDLLITDIGMPDLGGDQLIHQLDNEKIFIPIVVITGQTFESDQVEVIRKPFHPRAMVEQIIKRWEDLQTSQNEKFTQRSQKAG